ncbi:MAG: hypothetical protein KGI98_02725 [Euryarchaeota archaeon]|nr:hypothetical protein [Euryarchaeota archaeon]MDE2043669.1 hypothetical protein [Thermoplasmata archaeon]
MTPERPPSGALLAQPSSVASLPPPYRRAVRPPLLSSSSDLAFELYRQNTLMVLLASCIRRTADRIPAELGLSRQAIRRAVEIHGDYVLGFHYAQEELVNAVLQPKTDPRIFDGLLECQAEHPRARLFQKRVSELSIPDDEPDRLVSPARASELAHLFRAEADRIERHLGREEELLHVHLSEWLSKDEQLRLLRKMRSQAVPSIPAEILVLEWASEIGPSAD